MEFAEEVLGSCWSEPRPSRQNILSGLASPDPVFEFVRLVALISCLNHTMADTLPPDSDPHTPTLGPGKFFHRDPEVLLTSYCYPVIFIFPMIVHKTAAPFARGYSVARKHFLFFQRFRQAGVLVGKQTNKQTAEKIIILYTHTHTSSLTHINHQNRKVGPVKKNTSLSLMFGCFRPQSPNDIVMHD